MRYLLMLCVITVSLCADAQDQDSVRRWGFDVGGSMGNVVVVDEYQKKWQKGKQNYSVSLSAHHISLQVDSDALASDYGYPTLSIGAKFAFNHGVTMHKSTDTSWGYAEEVDYDSQMGNSVALYLSFDRPLWRSKSWEWDYSLAAGVGYSRRKYHPDTQVDNELIGSRWLIYFGAGTHLTYRVAPEWGIKAGLDYWHLSNGALNRPNKGVNFLGPSLALTYYPYYNKVYGANAIRYQPPFHKHLFAHAALGVGMRTLIEDWSLTQFHTPKGEKDYRTDQFKLYMTYSLQLDVMCRYARRWATGIGADLFYGLHGESERIMAQQDGEKVEMKPWSFGLAVKHMAFYKRLALHMSLGAYLYRKVGSTTVKKEKPYYECIGLFYSFPKLGGLAIGASVKAHRIVAEYTEMVISYPLQFK